MTTTKTTVNNGVNVQALLDARVALTAEPDLADFQWRVSSVWINGTHSRSTVQGFTGLRRRAVPQDGVPATTSTTPSASHPRITAPPRPSSCSSAWRVASPPASPTSRRCATSSCDP